MNASWRPNRGIYRFSAWLATFAILLAALAPSISHAVTAAKGGASWIEICTTGGTSVVQVPADQTPGTPAQEQKSVHLEHCPFCANHAGSFGLVPTAVAALPAASGSALLPDLFYRAPRPLFVWAAGQPRAPPAA
jgi:hypothetical protein